MYLGGYEGGVWGLRLNEGCKMFFYRGCLKYRFCEFLNSFLRQGGIIFVNPYNAFP